MPSRSHFRQASTCDLMKGSGPRRQGANSRQLKAKSVLRSIVKLGEAGGRSVALFSMSRKGQLKHKRRKKMGGIEALFMLFQGGENSDSPPLSVTAAHGRVRCIAMNIRDESSFPTRIRLSMTSERAFEASRPRYEVNFDSGRRAEARDWLKSGWTLKWQGPFGGPPPSFNHLLLLSVAINVVMKVYTYLWQTCSTIDEGRPPLWSQARERKELRLSSHSLLTFPSPPVVIKGTCVHE